MSALAVKSKSSGSKEALLDQAIGNRPATKELDHLAELERSTANPEITYPPLPLQIPRR